MRLTTIIENMDRMPETLKGFNDSPKLTTEQKTKLMDMVRRYNELGQTLKMENSLVKLAQSLTEISELAETYACNEAQDWFATEVVKKDFKNAKNISTTFTKMAKECHNKVQQLNALYEDMGHILGRYYEIADPIEEVTLNTSNMRSQRELPIKPPAIKEVKPNVSNMRSQRELPVKPPAIKEVKPNVSNMRSQRELPVKPPAIKEVKPNVSNMRSQRDLPIKPPAIKEVKPNVSNMRSQRELSIKPPAIKEVKPNVSNMQSQKELPRKGSVKLKW